MVIPLQSSFDEFKKLEVYDKKGELVGKVNDFAFTLNDFSITKVTLAGSFIEELKESLGMKDDDDPVVNLENFEKREGNKVFLNVVKNELLSKLDKSAIGTNEILFSKFKGTNVLCYDGEKVGRVINAIIHSDNAVNFIVGDSPFKEFAEKVGLTPDVDILVPNHMIESHKGDALTLKTRKAQLVTTLNDNPMTTEPLGTKVNFSALAAKEAKLSRFRIN